ERLLAVNREFYATVAEPFDSTRGGLPMGWQALHDWLPAQPAAQPLRVVDVGCGNGRWARALDSWGLACDYVGVDNDARLLDLASHNTRALRTVQSRFVAADFTLPDWTRALEVEPADFDLVVCFAALHHVPGYALR